MPQIVGVDSNGHITIQTSTNGSGGSSSGGSGGGDGSAVNQEEQLVVLEEVRDRVDTLIGLLSSALAADGGFTVESKSTATTHYIIQQNELSSDWTVQSPISYPDLTVYVTKKGNTLLEYPTIVQTTLQQIDAYTIRVLFGSEPCAGFVSLR